MLSRSLKFSKAAKENCLSCDAFPHLWVEELSLPLDFTYFSFPVNALHVLRIYFPLIFTWCITSWLQPVYLNSVLVTLLTPILHVCTLLCFPQPLFLTPGHEHLGVIMLIEAQSRTNKCLILHLCSNNNKSKSHIIMFLNTNRNISSMLANRF